MRTTVELSDPLYRRLMDASRHEPEATTADAISAAARQCAHTLSAAAIVTYTNTGSTTLRAARERPDVRILCLTPNLNTARRMTLMVITRRASGASTSSRPTTRSSGCSTCSPGSSWA